MILRRRPGTHMAETSEQKDESQSDPHPEAGILQSQGHEILAQKMALVL